MITTLSYYSHSITFAIIFKLWNAFLPSKSASDGPNIASWWHLLVAFFDNSFLLSFWSNAMSYSHKKQFWQQRPDREKRNYCHCHQKCCHLMMLMHQVSNKTNFFHNFNNHVFIISSFFAFLLPMGWPADAGMELAHLL